MKKLVGSLALISAICVTVPAVAKGAVKGAVVRPAAGHMVGDGHAVAGAAAGTAIGHRHAKVKACQGTAR